MGRRNGVPNLTEDDKLTFVEFIKQIRPTTSSEWQEVANLFNARDAKIAKQQGRAPAPRSRYTLKLHWDKLVTLKEPKGMVTSAVIEKVREAEKKLKNKASTTAKSETDYEEDGSTDDSSASDYSDRVPQVIEAEGNNSTDSSSYETNEEEDFEDNEYTQTSDNRFSVIGEAIKLANSKARRPKSKAALISRHKKNRLEKMSVGQLTDIIIEKLEADFKRRRLEDKKKTDHALKRIEQKVNKMYEMMEALMTQMNSANGSTEEGRTKRQRKK